MYFRTLSEAGLRIRIKIEVNTHERSPARPHIHVRHGVDSRWWSGEAGVRTFEPAELIATKIRALYQRSKGRDLFDLWLALTELHLEPGRILDAFGPYRPDGLTAALSIANLRAKVSDAGFRADLAPLVVDAPPDYHVETAAELIIAELLSGLR